MRIIKIIDTSNDIVGLYFYMGDDDPQKAINRCRKKTDVEEKRQIKENKEMYDDSVDVLIHTDEIFNSFLVSEGFHPVDFEEYQTDDLF